jgi:hypothetical protein
MGLPKRTLKPVRSFAEGQPSGCERWTTWVALFLAAVAQLVEPLFCNQ